MQVQILKCMLHRAELTACELNYEGSLSIDLDLLDLAGILPYEKILVVNQSNGLRLETYAIPAARGSFEFCLNGAAARLHAGDLVTVMAFASDGACRGVSLPAQSGRPFESKPACRSFITTKSTKIFVVKKVLLLPWRNE